MKTILITYPFFRNGNESVDEICGTDKRNLWCHLLSEDLKKTGYQVVCSQNMQFIETLDVRCEINVNATPQYTRSPRIGLFIEPPTIEPKNNVQYAKKYDRVVTYNPELLKLNNTVKANLPCWSPSIFSTDYSERSGYVLIAANKHLQSSQHFKDLYAERRKVIRWFEKNKRLDFHLYGKNWNLPGSLIGKNPIFKAARKLGFKNKLRNYKGEIQSKYQKLQTYEFNFCYENCVFPDYVSEKIFDAFAAKCIPIYWSNPSTQELLDPSSFIDASSFNSITELVSYCDHLTHQEKINFREAGQKFLKESGEKFSHEKYAKIIFKNIKELVHV